MTRARGVLTAILWAAAAAGRAAAEEPPAVHARASGERPRAWGTALVTYTVVDFSQLSPRNSAIGVECVQSCRLRYATSVVPEPFYAPVRVPAGALLTYMEIDYYDASVAGQAWATLGVCDPAGASCQGFAGPCSNGAMVCSGDADDPGFFSHGEDISGYGIAIDNAQQRYVLTAGNSTADGSTAISQIILGYVRQVSPPPQFASFADVPTSHPFFQFVEALVASGVTAGCGNGNYCPNAPLTRGQMAVFLAKALGLQWN